MKTGGQRGGFAMGLVAGLLVGLAVALAVALYITKAPNPFVDKVPNRTAEQDSAEAARNKTWDPNAPLGGKPVAQAASGAVGVAPAADGASAAAPAPTAPVAGATPAPVLAPAPAVAGASAPAARPAPGRDPAAILAGGAGGGAPAADPFVYFVQAGAYARTEEAEQQRARLALMGLTARITEREQAGRVMHRVRVGPFNTRDDADSLQVKLQEQSIEAQIVRVEKP